MIKRLLLLLPLLLSVVSPAFALTLGQIHVNSYINEPLKAVIDVKSATRAELAALTVGLGSKADFKRAGVDWMDGLKDLRFAVIEKSDGIKISVSTERSVIDPFLSFVVAADWAKGKAVKDFTVLLDPPIYSLNKSSPIEAALAGEVKAPTVAEIQPLPPVKEKPVTKKQSIDAVSAAKPYARATRSGDTLWKLASRVTPPKAKTQQTVVAMLEANPNAFSGGNMNRLQAGKVLQIPPPEVIRAISATAAQRRIADHERAWRTGESLGAEERLTPVSVVAETAGAAPVVAAEEMPDGRLMLASATDATSDVAASTGSQDQGESGDGKGGVQGLAKEESARDQQEIAELKSRVDELQTTLDDAKRLIDLKDAQLAQLQDYYRRLNEGELTSPNEQPPEFPAAEAVVAPEAKASEEVAVAPEMSSDDALSAVVDADNLLLAAQNDSQMDSGQSESGGETAAVAGNLDSVVDADNMLLAPVETAPAPESATATTEIVMETVTAPEMPAAAEEVAGVIATEKAPATQMPAAVKPEPVPETVKPASDPAPVKTAEPAVTSQPPADVAAVETIPSEPESSYSLYYAIGGALVVGLGILLLLLRRRGSDDDEPVTFVNDQEFVATQPTESVEVEATSPAPVADPLARASVLLAYNEFDDAREVLVEALKSDPENSELRSKLVDALYASRDSDGVNEQMEWLAATDLPVTNAERWSDLEEMQRELQISGTAAESLSSEVVSDEDDLDAALDAFEKELSEQDSKISLNEAGNMLAETAEILDEEVAAEPEPVDEMSEEEAAAASFFASAKPESTDEVAQVEEIGFDTDIDFDFDSTPLKPLETADVELPSETEAEFDPMSLAFETAEAGDLEQAEASPDTGIISQDDVVTMIDLAKAFADMGDADGAKEMLEEALQKSDDGQRSEIEELIKQYG